MAQSADFTHNGPFIYHECWDYGMKQRYLGLGLDTTHLRQNLLYYEKCRSQCFLVKAVSILKISLVSSPTFQK